MAGSKDRVVNVKNFGNDLRNKLDTIIESVCSKFSFFSLIQLYKIVWRNLSSRVVPVKIQGHPTTFFCKITVRRSKYSLKMFKLQKAKSFCMTVLFV